jgi:hypothetical protein
MPQLAYVPLVVERRALLYHQVGELLHAHLQRLYHTTGTITYGKVSQGECRTD